MKSFFKKYRYIFYVLGFIAFCVLAFDIEKDEIHIVEIDGKEVAIPGAVIRAEQQLQELKENEPVGKTPEETLIAPFAEKNTDVQALKIETIEDLSMPVRELDLDKPHLSAIDLQQWVSEVVGIVLSVDGSRAYADNAQRVATYFTPGGYQQYKDYLGTLNIDAALASNRYEMLTYVDNAPLKRNEGESNGAYFWVYDSPASLTVREKGNAANSDQKTMDIIVRTAVIRVPTGGGMEGIQISGWRVIPR